MNTKLTIATLTGIVLVLAFAVNLAQVDNQATAQTPFPSREKVITVTGTATASVLPEYILNSKK